MQKTTFVQKTEEKREEETIIIFFRDVQQTEGFSFLWAKGGGRRLKEIRFAAECN